MVYNNSRNTRLRRDFPRPLGERRLWVTSAFGGGKRKYEKKNWGAWGALNSFKPLTRVMRITNVLGFEIGQR